MVKTDVFQRAWFGPFSTANPYGARPLPLEPVGQVYDQGPLDGLKTTSMWAQRMAQIPLVNPAQNPGLGYLNRPCLPGDPTCVASKPLPPEIPARAFPMRTFPVSPRFFA